jgi:hypothetical protein
MAGSDSDTKLQAVERQLFNLTTQVMYASENGLFRASDWRYKNKIDEAIQRAEAALEKKDLLAASSATYDAKRYFDEAWNGATKRWLISFERGWIHHLFTFIGAGMAASVLWIFWDHELCDINHSSALFGMLGALSRCLYWTTYKANQRMLRRVWAVQNFFAPLIGLILGCVAYFILRSGLIIVTQENAEPNRYVSGILVFYAGFNWEWVLSLLGKAANQVRPKGNDSKNSHT